MHTLVRNSRVPLPHYLSRSLGFVAGLVFQNLVALGGFQTRIESGLRLTLNKPALEEVVVEVEKVIGLEEKVLEEVEVVEVAAVEMAWLWLAAGCCFLLRHCPAS